MLWSRFLKFCVVAFYCKTFDLKDLGEIMLCDPALVVSLKVDEVAATDARPPGGNGQLLPLPLGASFFGWSFRAGSQAGYFFECRS
jgi:hypothetical protein